jgi:phosphate starvation-inducible membrane PsiE
MKITFSVGSKKTLLSFDLFFMRGSMFYPLTIYKPKKEAFGDKIFKNILIFFIFLLLLTLPCAEVKIFQYYF